MRRRSLFATLAAPALLTRGAFAQGNRATTLRVVPETLTTLFDPHFTTSFTTRDFAYLVFDTLFAVNDRWEPQPQMVERWTKSPDGSEYVFTLRDGLAFHDGGPVTAEDCTASIRRWGARDSLGAFLIAATETLEPVDAKTFRLKLARPFGLVLEALAKPGAMVPMIMPKRLAETPPTRPVTEPMGSGPYRFVAAEYRPGERIVLERNAAYVPRTGAAVWASGPKRPTFERIELIAMPDVSTQVSALNTGEVDYLERVPADVLPALERNRAVKVQVVSPFGYQGILRFNHTQAPFDDVRVRRAVMLAVKQADYMAAVSGRPDFAKDCRSMYGCGTSYETEAGMPAATDFDAARRALQASGADLSKPIGILHPADAPGIAALGLVSQDLLTRLGFKVDMMTMDLNTFFGRRARPEGWHIFHTTNTVPDMQTPLQNAYLNGAGARGFVGWPASDAVEAGRAAFAAAADEPARKAAAESVHRAAAEAGFYMPLGQFVAPSAWRAELSDVPTGPAMFLWNIRRGG